MCAALTAISHICNMQTRTGPTAPTAMGPPHPENTQDTSKVFEIEDDDDVLTMPEEVSNFESSAHHIPLRDQPHLALFKGSNLHVCK